MNKILPIFIPHLGCPQQCVFCDQRAIAAQSAPTPSQVKEAIQQGLRYSDCPQVAFYGGSFTALPAPLQVEYLAAALPFVQGGLCHSLRISTRPDAIDAPTLDRLRRYRVETIELGAQSMDDGVLARARRGHTAAHTRDAARQVLAGGFELILQMMCGLPGETRQSCRQSAMEIAALGPHAARLYPVCVLRGTPLQALYDAGEYTPLSLEDAAEWGADVLFEFEKKQIPLVRIGLNPGPDLAEQVCAGPYHPALGELVRSRLLRRRAQVLLQDAPPGGELMLTVPPGKLPLLRGQKNENTRFFAQQYPARKVALAERAGQQSPVELHYIK